jgi:hypothetical protein
MAADIISFHSSFLDYVAASSSIWAFNAPVPKPKTEVVQRLDSGHAGERLAAAITFGLALGAQYLPEEVRIGDVLLLGCVLDDTGWIFTSDRNC